MGRVLVTMVKRRIRIIIVTFYKQYYSDNTSQTGSKTRTGTNTLGSGRFSFSLVFHLLIQSLLKAYFSRVNASHPYSRGHLLIDWLTDLLTYRLPAYSRPPAYSRLPALTRWRSPTAKSNGKDVEVKECIRFFYHMHIYNCVIAHWLNPSAVSLLLTRING